jgi:hypothetical protein
MLPKSWVKSKKSKWPGKTKGKNRKGTGIKKGKTGKPLFSLK